MVPTDAYGERGRWVCNLYLLTDAYGALGGWVRKFGLLTDAYLGGWVAGFGKILYLRNMWMTP